MKCFRRDVSKLMVSKTVLISILILSFFHYNSEFNKIECSDGGVMKRDDSKYVDNVPLEERIYILSKTFNIIEAYFAHWQAIPKLDIDRLFKTYIKKVINAKSRYEFDLLMMELIGSLKNGHSWYYDEWLIKNYGQSLGFVLFYLDNEWVVYKSELNNLRPGDVVKKINGEDFEDFFQRQKKYINASSEREARVKLNYRPYLFPEKFKLELSDKQVVEIERLKNKIKNSEGKTEGKWLKMNNIAYIKIPSFRSPEFEEKAIEYVKQFKKANLLIIDVRGNGGGRTPSALIDALQDRPYRSWTESTPLNIGLFKAYEHILREYGEKLQKEYKTVLEMLSYFFKHSNLMWQSDFQKPENTIYRGKLVILVDRRCASACEDFIMPFKDNKRAIIIGERTIGSSGQPFNINFGEGIRVSIGTKREYFPDGSPFEGIGIKPDIEIKLTIELLKSGRDIFLETALNIIN